jgi:hypothetical protein
VSECQDILSCALLIVLSLRWTEIKWIELFSRAMEVVLWCAQIHMIQPVISRRVSLPGALVVAKITRLESTLMLVCFGTG